MERLERPYRGNGSEASPVAARAPRRSKGAPDDGAALGRRTPPHLLSGVFRRVPTNAHDQVAAVEPSPRTTVDDLGARPSLLAQFGREALGLACTPRVGELKTGHDQPPGTVRREGGRPVQRRPPRQDHAGLGSLGQFVPRLGHPAKIGGLDRGERTEFPDGPEGGPVFALGAASRAAVAVAVRRACGGSVRRERGARRGVRWRVVGGAGSWSLARTCQFGDGEDEHAEHREPRPGLGSRTDRTEPPRRGLHRRHARG